MNNRPPQPHNYYGPPPPPHGGYYPPPNNCGPMHPPHPGCHPPHGPGLDIVPAAPWDKAIAEHNLDKHSHPYILSLIKANTTNKYFCKDTIVERDNIGEELRSEGLMVYVMENDTVYRLQEGLTNEDWRELSITDDKTVRIGRFNPPLKPQLGTVYFDLTECRIKVYTGQWINLPTKLDIDIAIANHNSDANAHADRFADADNLWFAIE